MDLGLLHDLAQPSTSKIILCSLDGFGGLPRPGTGKSELETARLPHLHALAPNGLDAVGIGAVIRDEDVDLIHGRDDGQVAAQQLICVASKPDLVVDGLSCRLLAPS